MPSPVFFVYIYIYICVYAGAHFLLLEKEKRFSLWMRDVSDSVVIFGCVV